MTSALPKPITGRVDGNGLDRDARFRCSGVDRQAAVGDGERGGIRTLRDVAVECFPVDAAVWVNSHPSGSSW
ncbi:MAG: hypothetical protein QM729_21040 [Solirubrobacterales bacterium]